MEGSSLASVSDAYEKLRQDSIASNEKILAELTNKASVIGPQYEELSLAGAFSSQPLLRHKKDYIGLSPGLPTSSAPQPNSTTRSSTRRILSHRDHRGSPSNLSASSVGGPHDKFSPRAMSASQPPPSTRTLRPRNEAGIAAQRSASALLPSSSQDSVIPSSLVRRVREADTSRKASVKRKREEPAEEPRTRQRIVLKESEKSETSAPEAGRTSDGQIDYRYYVNKYLNQRSWRASGQK